MAVAIVSGIACFMLFGLTDELSSDYVIRNSATALAVISGSLALLSFVRLQSMLTIFDERYSDSLQRLEDYVDSVDAKLFPRSKSILYFGGFWLLISCIVSVTLKDRDLIALLAAYSILIPVAITIQKAMIRKDRKLIKEFKLNMESQASDISM